MSRLSRNLLCLALAGSALLLLAFGLSGHGGLGRVEGAGGRAERGRRKPPKSLQPRKDDSPVLVYRKWENFDTKDGLPADKVPAVLVQGDRIWAGTGHGLAYREEGRWHTVPKFAENVISLAACELTGDVWIGTVRGLFRYSAGRIDQFNQFNSGLTNDVVYGLVCVEGEVWAATAGGLSVFDPAGNTWELYTERNAPMHEPWCYAVSADGNLIYVAVWGGGLLEFHRAERTWKVYHDPDKELEYDLFPDDGLVHEVISGVSYVNGLTWVATYFGLSKYNGKRWWGYFEETSGLASNFINFVRGRGNAVWVATDRGLSSFDGDLWVTYQRKDEGEGCLLIAQRGKSVLATETLEQGIGHNLLWGVDFDKDEVWVGTDHGISHGFAGGPPSAEWLKQTGAPASE